MRKKENNFTLKHTLTIVIVYVLLISLPILSRTMVKHSLIMEKDKKVLIDSVEKGIEKINLKDSIRLELIKEVEGYIFKSFPKANKTLPSTIVKHGLEHEIDIMFMMAQTQQETCFGTAGAGRASSRHSLFGVANKKYNSYDKAVKDYIVILKKSYLKKGRTEHHLMKKYTTIGGARYAGDPNYEVRLREAYSKINRATNINRLQKKYRELS